MRRPVVLRLHDLGHGPCAGCQLESECRDAKKACAVFVHWVDAGTFDPKKVRKPTRQIYVRLYGSK